MKCGRRVSGWVLASRMRARVVRVTHVKTRKVLGDQLDGDQRVVGLSCLVASW